MFLAGLVTNITPGTCKWFGLNHVSDVGRSDFGSWMSFTGSFVLRPGAEESVESDCESR